jgi:exodeoxyribonuclease VII small subunit
VAKKTAKSSQPSFEKSLAELEAIVSDLEGGDLGLAAALSRYESGVKHLKACYELLSRAERRIELVTGVDADGNPTAEPFEADDHADDSVPGARSRKRSAKSTARKGGSRRHTAAVDDGETLF